MKSFIKNRKQENICVRIEKTQKSKGLAFVMHGCGGNKDESHIRTYIKSFLDNNVDVVSFDTTNTFGESDGKYEDSTITNYLEDLEDVIKWSETQDFYREPFFLVSHSCSGLCTGTYAWKNKNKIKALAPTATVVSGKITWELKKDSLEKWKKDGYIMQRNSMSHTGFRKLKWKNMEDRLQYDLLELAPDLNIPVLLMVGNKDTSTPLKYQQLLFEKLPEGNKELHVFNGPHYDFNEKQLNEMYDIMNKWIRKVLKG